MTKRAGRAIIVLRGPQFLEGGGSPRLPVDQGEPGLSPHLRLTYAHAAQGGVTLEGELGANFSHLGSLRNLPMASAMFKIRRIRTSFQCYSIHCWVGAC